MVKLMFDYLRDLKVILKSHFFKKFTNKTVFAEKTILFKRINISNCQIGRYTYFAGNGSINNAKIGAFCSIADGVHIGIGTHPTDWVSTHPCTFSKATIFPYRIFGKKSQLTESSEVTIGNDVWIGLNAIILDGVRIGNGVVVAAGSIVTKDVDDYCIVAGVPARVIKRRASLENINDISWWDLDDDKLALFLKGIDDAAL